MEKEMRRYSFELTTPHGKTAYRSPMHFEHQADRDACVQTAHAAFVFSYGERAYVRKTELTV
jgi:hypothetical protein